MSPLGAPRALVYGATGYSAGLIVDRLLTRGIHPVLAGRDCTRVQSLAERLGCEPRVFAVDDPTIESSLRDVRLVLNCASPFVTTTRPLAAACLRTQTHYLDIGGDIDAYPMLHEMDAAARERGVLLAPGVGYLTAVSDALAGEVAAGLPTAKALAISLSRPELWSRGSIQTMLELWTSRVPMVSSGALATIPIGTDYRTVDFGAGDRRCTLMRWPDVYTVYQSTGIPNVRAYGELDATTQVLIDLTRTFGGYLDVPVWRDMLRRLTDGVPAGPSAEERRGRRRVMVAEAIDATGGRVTARLETPEPYGFTAELAAAAVERVLAGPIPAGFRTPTQAFGRGLVLDRPDVELVGPTRVQPPPVAGSPNQSAASAL